MGSIECSVRIEGNLLTSDLEDRVQAASQRGLAVGAEYLLEVANRTVPFLEGHLERSGEARVSGDEATVGYDIVYARYQHEGVGFNHTMPGRRAKWLELSLIEEKDNILRIIGNEIDRELS